MQAKKPGVLSTSQAGVPCILMQHQAVLGCVHLLVRSQSKASTLSPDDQDSGLSSCLAAVMPASPACAEDSVTPHKPPGYGRAKFKSREAHSVAQLQHPRHIPRTAV